MSIFSTEENCFQIGKGQKNINKGLKHEIDEEIIIEQLDTLNESKLLDLYKLYYSTE